MNDIHHFVILMLENRSFDHMLGYLVNAGMDIDGVVGATNEDKAGNKVRGYHLDSTRVRVRPHHHREQVVEQINGGKMDGFVRGYGPLANLSEIMGWYDQRDVPVYDALARQYSVCDHWHSSFAGPTWPNRFFAMCGTSSGITDNLTWTDHLTFFDLLPDDSWRYYSHDVAFLRTVKRYKGHRGLPIEKVSSFYRACVDGTLPQVSWIDPNFTLYDIDALLNWANDDHPPADIGRGQNLVARIYNHLIAGPGWRNTLFVVVYDEHGGFYDHASPPPSFANESAPFDTLGLRVPALVVSPWVPKGTPYHELLDHTCIARTALELFAPNRRDDLSPRVSKSPSLLQLLTEPEAREDATRLEGVPTIEAAIAPVVQSEVASRGFHSMELTDNQQNMKVLKNAALGAGVPSDNL
jgi:phospholipase C